jgi:hypothetical protein
VVATQVPKMDWVNLKLPEGRDAKSCRNMFDAEKRKHGMNKGGPNEAKTPGTPNDGDATPTAGKKGSAKKSGNVGLKKGNAAGTAAPGSGTGDPADGPLVTPADDNNGTPTQPQKPPRKRKSLVIKDIMSPLVSSPLVSSPLAGKGDGTIGGLGIDSEEEEKPKRKRPRAYTLSKTKKGAVTDVAGSKDMPVIKEGQEVPVASMAAMAAKADGEVWVGNGNSVTGDGDGAVGNSNGNAKGKGKVTVLKHGGASNGAVKGKDAAGDGLGEGGAVKDATETKVTGGKGGTAGKAKGGTASKAKAKGGAAGTDTGFGGATDHDTGSGDIGTGAAGSGGPDTSDPAVPAEV